MRLRAPDAARPPFMCSRPVSNRRKLAPRQPDASERAFRDALAEGCPHCGSRTVTGRFRGVWDFRLSCRPGCPTFTDSQKAHAVAARAAERAGLVTGEALLYQAVDSATGAVAGVVRARS